MIRMKVYIYKGGLRFVRKSGVGSAIHHQEEMLATAGVAQTATSAASPTGRSQAESRGATSAARAELWHGGVQTDNLCGVAQCAQTGNWQEASVVHINTVFPDSVLVAWLARRQGKKVVWYGHSTMEDFRNSFIGSNLAAPLFKRWIRFCYNLGDIVVTPTAYSRWLLAGYGLRRPVAALTNGVDTALFQPDAVGGACFRARYEIAPDQKVVISAGHLIRRKGIFDFLALARMMPDVMFFWFGSTARWMLTAEVRRALQSVPKNVCFAGFVPPNELCEAYSGADAFLFCSHEETEGIVVLEALASGVPVVLRDIPVYEEWLEDGVQVLKAKDTAGFARALRRVFAEDTTEMTARGRALAEEHSLAATGAALLEIYRHIGISR